MLDSSATVLQAPQVRAWIAELRTADLRQGDAERVELIRALEELACAGAAAQAVLTADLDTSQRAEQAAAGVPPSRQGRGVAAQVALARRESPHRGAQHLGLATTLRRELPHTMAAFRAGRISEWRATLVARETACLALEHRREVDTELASIPERIEAMGDGELVAQARTIAYRLDPAAFVARRARAEEERRVSLRPAPDVMTHLSALLKVKDGVAVWAVLSHEASRLKADGDQRTRGQIMADTLVDRVLLKNLTPTTATTTAEDGGEADPIRVTLNVVVPDSVLLGEDPQPAHLMGYGPIPADLMRELAQDHQTWIRRLYARPETGALVAMDSHTRLMPPALANLLRLRDRTCRTPWCDAPIRHSDHVQSFEEGGPTSAANGQGLCQACNHAKQAPGWHARPSPGPRHTVATTTPTGHTHHSTAPPPGTERWVLHAPGHWILIA